MASGPREVLVLFATAAAIGGCTPFGEAEPEAACPPEAPAFSYEEDELTGPSRWKDIAGPDGGMRYPLCGGVQDGRPVQQSPIAIATAGLASQRFGLGAELRWADVAPVSTLWNNGHTWQAGISQPMTLQANGGLDYRLAQLHFHAPSEHEIDGKKHPLEIHFVHLRDGGQPFDPQPFAAVIAVMVDEDAAGADNPELAKLWGRFARCPEEAPSPATGITLGLTALLPADRAYVRYDGSLTTPPCSVTVTFHVLTTPIRASARQIAALTASVGRNDRPVQPLVSATQVTLHPAAR